MTVDTALWSPEITGKRPRACYCDLLYVALKVYSGVVLQLPDELSCALLLECRVILGP